MLGPFKLLLPALIPSWNFFEVIHDSPRVEYALSPSPEEAGDWREFRPRPGRLSAPAMLARLFWNARWNESLFVVSCAERLLEEPTVHSEAEIFRRIAADLQGEGWLSFRIVLLGEQKGEIVREVAFVSEPRALSDIPVR